DQCARRGRAWELARAEAEARRPAREEQAAEREQAARGAGSPPRASRRCPRAPLPALRELQHLKAVPSDGPSYDVDEWDGLRSMLRFTPGLRALSACAGMPTLSPPAARWPRPRQEAAGWPDASGALASKTGSRT